MKPQDGSGRGIGQQLDADLSEELLASVPPRGAGQEVRVGMLVIFGVLAGLVALFVLTDASTFRGRYVIGTRLSEAGGLRRGDPVQLRGVNIGRVQGFEIEGRGVLIRLELEGEYEVPRDSRVVLGSPSLLGGRTVFVDPGISTEKLKDGDLVPGRLESDPLAQAADVGERADTVLQRAQALLSERTIGAVGTSAVELQQLLAELTTLATEQRRELALLQTSLRRSAAGVERATGGVEQLTTGPQLLRAVARTDTLTASLDSTARTLGRAGARLEAVFTRLEGGQGTLGRLSRDDSLYLNMNRAVTNLNQLVNEIRANPKRFFSIEVF